MNQANTGNYLGHGLRCPCHNAQVRDFCDHMGRALSRRSVLGGLLAGLMAPSLGLANQVLPGVRERPLLLRNVNIFDGNSDRLLTGHDVLIDGQYIKQLPASGTTIPDADVIDCGGRTLMPGLIDCHWHALLAALPELTAMTAEIAYVHLVAAQEAGRTLMRGFTTVRDVGGPSFAIKRAIDENRFPGPRIFPSGAMLTQTSGHADFRPIYELPRSPQTNLSHAEEAGISAIADGVPEVLRRTREQLMHGASQIKITVGGGVSSAYDPLESLQFTDAEIQAAVAAARDWQTYVCAHVYTSAGINRAIDNGVQCIEHGQLADETTVKRMASTGTWWSIQPFLSDEDANPKADPRQRQQQKEIAEGTMRSFELGQKYKVNMAFGTDVLFNPAGTASQGRQLAKTARWFGNAGALRLATGNAGRLLALSGPRAPYEGALGVVQAGALADLLLIDGNPLEDIALIGDPDKNMKLIIKDGRVYKNTLTA